MGNTQTVYTVFMSFYRVQSLFRGQFYERRTSENCMLFLTFNTRVTIRIQQKVFFFGALTFNDVQYTSKFSKSVFFSARIP